MQDEIKAVKWALEGMCVTELFITDFVPEELNLFFINKRNSAIIRFLRRCFDFCFLFFVTLISLLLSVFCDTDFTFFSLFVTLISLLLSLFVTLISLLLSVFVTLISLLLSVFVTLISVLLSFTFCCLRHCLKFSCILFKF